MSWPRGGVPRWGVCSPPARAWHRAIPCADVDVFGRPFLFFFPPKTWGRAVAAALECEYSQIGFGGLGWAVPGGGGVVPLYTPMNPAQSSWNQIFAGAPRNFGPDIDYVFVL